jgi:hypothetical protein
MSRPTHVALATLKRVATTVEIKTREAKTFMVDEFGSKIPG